MHVVGQHSICLNSMNSAAHGRASVSTDCLLKLDCIAARFYWQTVIPIIKASAAPSTAAAEKQQAVLQREVAQFMTKIAAAQHESHPFSTNLSPSASCLGDAARHHSIEAGPDAANSKEAAPTPQKLKDVGDAAELMPTASSTTIGDGVPTWPAPSDAEFTDLKATYIRIVVILKWLEEPTQAKRKQAGPAELQLYLSLKQELMLLMAHLVTGHLGNAQLDVKIIVAYDMPPVLRAWYELTTSSRGSPILNDLLLGMFRRLVTDENHIRKWVLSPEGQRVYADEPEPDPWHSEALPLLCQYFCKSVTCPAHMCSLLLCHLLLLSPS